MIVWSGGYLLEGGGNLSGVRADSWSLNIRVSGREWFCLGLELTTDGYTISGDIWPRILIRLDQTIYVVQYGAKEPSPGHMLA